MLHGRRGLGVEGSRLAGVAQPEAGITCGAAAKLVVENGGFRPGWRPRFGLFGPWRERNAARPCLPYVVGRMDDISLSRGAGLGGRNETWVFCKGGT